MERALPQGRKGSWIDEWGRRLNYKAGKRDFDLFSSGPDGKPKTKDDEIYSRSFDFLFAPLTK